MKVAVFSTKYYEREFLNNYNKDNKHQLTFFEMALNAQTAHLATDFDAVSIQLNDKVDAAVIAQLSKSEIRLIDLRSAGYDNVDIKAALKNKITIMRVPAYSPQAIAEHAVALILTLDRKTHKAYNRVRENNFSLQNLMGFNLNGKTIGVIGTGKIGAVFCNIMLGFGCKIVAFDLIESKVLISKGVPYIAFDKLLEISDIISIHCPLTPKTRYLFDKKTFAKMKPGVMLINTSRGALIKTLDAITALKKGILGYLGIDVYEGEQKIFFKDLSADVIKDDLIERLMSFNNVIIAPHQAFFTQEALNEIARITIGNFTDFENGVHSENEVK